MVNFHRIGKGVKRRISLGANTAAWAWGAAG
jgi:hypothetical protein